METLRRRLSPPYQAVLAASAALVLLGGVAGCDRTIDGTVAMTTEAGPPISAPSTAHRPTKSAPFPTGSPSTTYAPAPANALELTCADYTKLDVAARRSVIHAIVTQKPSAFTAETEEIARTFVDAACPYLTDAVVADILSGSN
jgi:hypothetical protein